ncbi:SubName: Full=Uncharacterized protein {ECO:0000313/EMBL:CCA76528.1} [Serendipita indica DSM 11827]|uniref:Uncharacterized protein n=1 Tax=Serendipita indica (strain DSM 11827) TaxID=1109443 RepID=G4TYY5_SERID|nr:SubName: Full=Uncharacterized protein {ECO:0000313/EMBL:CCA76528.1} [Serendipita indica DSM 11827]CCA76528.1 hypothetical protein PIIN_10521 [Serendipita indica DSM 11827]
MALVPIINSGKYRIKNVKYGPIRDDEGALGAKGNSKSEELVWNVSLNSDKSYTLTPVDPAISAGPGGAISEVSKRFYVSIEDAAVSSKWHLQPVLIGSDTRILYAIYEPDMKGHWELSSSDKKEPVKLNRDPTDDENQPVPSHFTPEALWIFEHVIGDE